MEEQRLRERFDGTIEKMSAALWESKLCIAAYLLGSASHDQIWEWSDIQIAVILDDGYKGKRYYTLLEEGMYVALNVYTLTAFKEWIGVVHADDFMWKAFSKRTVLFSKDPILDELLDEAFIIGRADRQKEMLLAFSGAVYYLNKAEKNLYVKKNLENAVYFIPQIAENIALIEIFLNQQIPEREVIAQGRRYNPEVFAIIYDPLFRGNVDVETVKGILAYCAGYLEQHTGTIYQPVIAYLEEHGDLEYFKYETRPHGFGINYEWLVRCGIAERYGIPEKIPFLKQTEKLGYRKAEKT
ncbi:MAG: hypothetical protein HDQ98_17995 [Lachnospiraceae bacterium]|nr:hypothetical protein [Lachnospiraceae bacterium]